MKIQILCVSLVLLLLTAFQPTTAAPPGGDFLKTGVYLKNNAFKPKKITLITYGTFQAGHGTEVVTLLPGQKIYRKYLVGTKIYVADEDQMDIINKGGRIDDQEPFMVIRVRDRDEIYKLTRKPIKNSKASKRRAIFS